MHALGFAPDSTDPWLTLGVPPTGSPASQRAMAHRRLELGRALLSLASAPRGPLLIWIRRRRRRVLWRRHWTGCDGNPLCLSGPRARLLPRTAPPATRNWAWWASAFLLVVSRPQRLWPRNVAPSLALRRSGLARSSPPGRPARSLRRPDLDHLRRGLAPISRPGPPVVVPGGAGRLGTLVGGLCAPP